MLHAHLPYVFHGQNEKAIEERWLFEAITECYLPLLDTFERLVIDEIPFQISLSISPPLITMLKMKELQERYIQYLDQTIKLVERELEVYGNTKAPPSLIMHYYEHFKQLKVSYCTKWNRDLLAAFHSFEKLGHLELITTSITHAFLPYIHSKEGKRAQIQHGIDEFVEAFGSRPKGIWLPECAYEQALEELLLEVGIQYMYTDSHSIYQNENEKEKASSYVSPVVTPKGIVSLIRDDKLCRQVWSLLEGYPGDADYREYYRDLGFDAEENYIKPFLHPSGIRLNTGLKYHRITGKEHKDWYNPVIAKQKIMQHAEHYTHLLAQYEHNDKDVATPLITAAFDAELFGHWWYEGPQWIEQLCRNIATHPSVQMSSPSRYLEHHITKNRTELTFSTWGRNGHGEVWLNHKNCFIYPKLHDMEYKMMELVNHYIHPTDLEKRVLEQCARELFLLQSSDWAFILDNETTVEYAMRRMNLHSERFYYLVDQLASQQIDAVILQEIESLDRIAIKVNLSHFQTMGEMRKVNDKKSRVIVLSWEFPPLVIGGISAHVYELTRQLANKDVEVHVVTCHSQDSEAYEWVHGVHVHRCLPLQSDDHEFIDWVFQLNIAMYDKAMELFSYGFTFDMIHGHDWLVSYAATQLQEELKIPLVCTIHATEHGRNQGIFTSLQEKIFAQESKLMRQSQKVICCSKSMYEEIKHVYGIHESKIRTIPNGINVEHHVDSNKTYMEDWSDDPIVFFIGRLVREKGVHILLQSVPDILAHVPNAKFMIAGTGPMEEHLHQQVQSAGLHDRVKFFGFADEEDRYHLFRKATISVFPSLYEPFGIVALESMAANVPVIVSDVGGLSELVEHDQTGVKVPSHDIKALASSIIHMLQHHAWRDALAHAAYEKVKSDYRWDHIAHKTLEVYSDVTEKQKQNTFHTNDDGVDIAN